MNKIDAGFVVFSLFLVWTFIVFLVPHPAVDIIYQLTAGVMVGYMIGRLYLRLVNGSEYQRDHQRMEEMFEFLDKVSHENSRIVRYSFDLMDEMAAQQAEIDRLMFEYCPEDMTPEQIGRWAMSQVPVDAETEKKINDSLH